MRSVELAKVAASAEALRLRTLAKRQAMRGAYAAVAAVFAIAVVVVLHVLVWQAIVLWVPPLGASAILFAIDLVIAAVFGLMALKSSPSQVEREAQALRHQALLELKQSLGFLSLMAQLANLAFRTGVRSGARRTASSAFAEIASRMIGR